MVLFAVYLYSLFYPLLYFSLFFLASSIHAFFCTFGYIFFQNSRYKHPQSQHIHQSSPSSSGMFLFIYILFLTCNFLVSFSTQFLLSHRISLMNRNTTHSILSSIPLLPMTISHTVSSKARFLSSSSGSSMLSLIN